MSYLLDFPQFSTIDMNMFQEVTEFCRNLDAGVSEFLFSNIYLDSKKYQYTIARLSDESLILAGVNPTREFEGLDLTGKFLSVLGKAPSIELVEELFSQGYYWKNMTAAIYEELGQQLEQRGYRVLEDRDNFDYLYRRTDLASLQGKAFHKKKNLVNAFTAAYESQIKPLDVYTLPEARLVLESWRKTRPEDDPGDFEQCAFLAKKALCRSVSQKNPDEFYAEMEAEILERINRETGVGPQGFGGDTTALSVAIETAPTHIAGLPVAVNFGCHVTRHASEIL